MFNLCLHLIILFTIISLFFVKYKRNQLNFVITAIVATVITAGITKRIESLDKIP